MRGRLLEKGGRLVSQGGRLTRADPGDLDAQSFSSPGRLGVA